MSDQEFSDSPLKLPDDPPSPPDYSKLDYDAIQEEEMDDTDDDMDYDRTVEKKTSEYDEDDEDDVSLPEDINIDEIPGDEEDVSQEAVSGEDELKKNLGIMDDTGDEKEQDDEDDDEDDEDDDESFRKLEKDIDNDIILKHHPEIIQNNYQEILALCKIVRNDKGIIVDELHKTFPFITKYEYARIIGMRAKQLNNGADPFVKVERGIIDGYTIAKKEMEEKKIPFIIARPLPNGGREYWKLQDLEVIHF